MNGHHRFVLGPAARFDGWRTAKCRCGFYLSINPHIPDSDLAELLNEGGACPHEPVVFTYGTSSIAARRERRERLAR